MFGNPWKQPEVPVKTVETEYPGKLKLIEEKIVGLFIDVGKKRGINSKKSAITGYFYVRKKLTQKKIIHLTHFSTGTVSMILSQLESEGTISKTKPPGSRNFYYTINADTPDFTLNSEISLHQTFQTFLNFFNTIKERLDKPELMQSRPYPAINNFVAGMKEILIRYSRSIEERQEKEK